MRKKGRQFVILALAVAIVAAFGTVISLGDGPLAYAAPVQAKYGGSLRYALLRDPIGFDPHLDYGASSSYLQGNVYDTLVEYDERGRFRGALAESWEQPDNKTYVFKLRQGVTFHDGSTFDAQDVVATFNRIKDPKTAAASKISADATVRVEAPNPYLVRIVLREPKATFLHDLAGRSMYVVNAADVARSFDFKTKMNGTGPFMLADWEPQRRYVLRKHAKFWKKGLPYLDEITLTPISEDKSRVNALRSGEVGLAEYIPWQELSPLSGNFNVFLHFSVFNLVRINNSRPPLDNKKVRQALNFVVDRQEALDLAFGGQGRVMDGALQPFGSPYYVKELDAFYKKDWDKARTLLREAGFNNPADVPPIEMVSTGNVVLFDTAQVVLRHLQSFGLRVTMRIIDSPTLIKNRSDGTYAMQQDGQSMASPDPDYLREFFHSREGVRHAVAVKFKVDRLDQMLEQGGQLVNLNQRKKVYADAERFILDEAPWIFLFWRPQAEATARNVKGYVALPSGLGQNNVSRLEYLWIEK